MESKVTSTTFRAKEDFTLPTGAEIVEKKLSIYVEEIENGFIISKEYNITYKLGEDIEHSWVTKKIFKKENPMPDFEKLSEEDETKSLAEKL